MSDIVDRLRSDDATAIIDHGSTGYAAVLMDDSLLDDAADEIERLRALLRQALPHIEGNVGSWLSARRNLNAQGQEVAGQRIAEGDELIATIHREALK